MSEYQCLCAEGFPESCPCNRREDRVDRNVRIRELETVLERLVDAVGDVRISGLAARTYALHEAWKDARDTLARGATGCVS